MLRPHCPTLMRPPSRGGAVRFALLLGLLTALAAVAMAADLDPRHLLAEVRAWPLPAPVLTIGGCAVLVCAMVPRTALAFVAGTLFGTSTATPYVVLGVTLGAGLAFGVGRLLGRTFVATRLRGRAAAVERAVTGRGVWAVAAARMIPLAHFGLSNYAFGTTSIGLSRYLIGTALGIAPATAAYAALGAATARADATAAALAGAAVAVLTVTGLVGSALLWRCRPSRCGGPSRTPTGGG